MTCEKCEGTVGCMDCYIEYAESVMHIALDYDDTYTRSPALWNMILCTIMWSGHQAYIVTQNWRKDRPEIAEQFEPRIPVVYCGDSSKKPFCEMKGIHIDIWIDDSPGSIVGVY